ncbi:permease [Salinisphaera sp. PC39]|uniref:AI-2E family transporter n=1 Tax=Salinisphaera sp. PC39 TaxID=1304156 RepID=UPI00333F652F
MIVLLAVITAILVGWALKVTYVVTMPLTLAFFVALVLRPLQRRLNIWLPRPLHWLSLVVCMAVFLAVLGTLVASLWLSLSMVLAKAPAYAESAQQLWAQLQALAERHAMHVDMLTEPLRDLSGPALGWLTSGFGYLWLLMAMLFLVFFLVLLMLIEAGEWRDKMAAGLGEARSRAIMATVYAASEKVRRFLVVKTLVSALTGASSGLWLWLLGVDFALLWGLLIFLLNYIPYIGSTVAVFPAAIIALLQFGPAYALVVIAGLIVIQQILGNVVDPRLEGRSLAISPIVVLVSIVFWGWVWGLVGTLIGVLLTATLVIVFEHIPALRPVAVLLSRRAPNAPLPDVQPSVSQLQRGCPR